MIDVDLVGECGIDLVQKKLAFISRPRRLNFSNINIGRTS